MSVLGKHICTICGKRYFRFFHKRCPHCDDIDFANILYCKIEHSEMTYRTEERYHWEKYYYDGSFHSLAEPYEVTLENGINYTFIIVYDNDRPVEQRTYHESNPFCKQLLAKVNNNPITESFDETIEAISNIGNFKELTPEEIKKYRGSCAQRIKDKVECLHYSKQEIFECLRDYYTEQEINDAFLEVEIDFKKEAVIRAKEYVESFGGSYKNVKQYLESDKFTPEEVVFGAENCGADWKEEAIRAAKKYIEHNGEYSFEKMVFQLTWFDFTQEEAEHAAKHLELLPDEQPERWHHNGS